MPQGPAASLAPIPPAPGPRPIGIRSLFALRDARRRWPFAARAGLCMGVPVVIGWAAGDTAAGLMATIGGFTALYGSALPYVYRAGRLALIAASLAFAVGMGMWAAAVVWVGVLVVALIAMVATLLCNALAVGPPGAYMVALACAAGTAMHAGHLSPWHTGLLVLAGGGFAWLVHMSGALLWPRGPEKSAVAAAGDAVARFAEAVGTPRQDTARHWAALAMHESWAALVSYQPIRTTPDSTLSRLRRLNRELHLIFADAMRAAARDVPMDPAVPDRARRLAAQAQHPSSAGAVASEEEIPLGGPGPLGLVRQAVMAGSGQLLVTLRVGAAALVAGMIGAALSLDHAYWALAAAVLMLHQGFDWFRTVQRGLERLVGTWVGLILALGVLTAHPTGLWLALTVVLLQFSIEMFVVRNYALAVIFITTVALTIVSGGQRVSGLGGLLLARGVDTAIGCAVAFAVLLVTMRVGAATRIPSAINRTLEAVGAVSDRLAESAVTTPGAWSARRDLQLQAIGVLQAYDASVNSSVVRRSDAELMWPTVVATQRLAYRVLSACWTLEQVGSGSEAARGVSRSLFSAHGDEQLHRALAALAGAIRTGTAPAPLGEVPSFLSTELLTLYESLVQTAPDS
ncbi:FUSC family protein [Streptomyces sp. NPDC001312]|uniref:FUSC family protein n=1 Tax=Streptomyces sp. NPDC001312 TaxID=3364561 RepID=UPI0036CAD2E5